MLIQGADFLDLGGMSTRPGSSEITLDEELKRVVPTVEAIMKEFPEAIISVDTYRSKVAKHSVEAGASLSTIFQQVCSMINYLKLWLS